MDGSRFDDLVKSLGAVRSRRQTLGALAGAALAAAGIGRANAAAKRSVGNACATNNDCASGLCVQETPTRKICHCRSSGDCPAATAQCQTAACLPTGYCGTAITPGASCSDGNRCTTGDVCQGDGSCVGAPVICTATNECWTAGSCQAADGQCSTETYHGDGATCSAGVCWSGACCAPEDQATTCAGGLCGLQVNNCGQTVPCLTLGGGACQADTECCSGACVGAICQAGKVATGGTCDSNADCATGHCCGTVCRDFMTDIANCGYCGNVCPSTHMATVVCSNGVCGGTCAANYANCDGNMTNGCETDLRINHGNCGSCGVSCAMNQTCQNGVCVCVPEDSSVTCAGGKCGAHTNNCGVSVDCGGCASGQVCASDGSMCKSTNPAPTCAGQNAFCAAIPACGSNQLGACACVPTVEGGGICEGGSIAYGACETSADCPGAQLCVDMTCDGLGKFCMGYNDCSAA